MIRRTFIHSAGATAVLGLGYGHASARQRAADETTQSTLFAALPRPKAGDWVRFVMGSGVTYQKQIGAAREATENGALSYYETQVGTTGGSCNPNTMKRTYLRAPAFTSLIERARVLADVANSGTTLTRWSDAGGGQTQSRADAYLHLLDALYVYDERPLHVVASRDAMLRLPARAAYGGSDAAGRGPLRTMPVKHVVATFAPARTATERLTRIELWTTPEVPFGVAKYRALARGLEPFELELYSYGTRFKTDLAMSLETIRSLTPDGTHIQTT